VLKMANEEEEVVEKESVCSCGIDNPVSVLFVNFGRPVDEDEDDGDIDVETGGEEEN
jgi:hypothetical protein